MVNEDHWREVSENRIYLSPEYLRAVEQSIGDDRQHFRYIMFYDSDYQPAGIAYVQLLPFSYTNTDEADKICGMTNKIRREVVASLKDNILLCGNAFATGQNGFLFRNDIDEKTVSQCLSSALYRLRRSEKIYGNVTISLLKEFWPDAESRIQSLRNFDFRPFEIDVNMVLNMREGWLTMEDYMADMTSKFRTKMKGILKRSKGLEVREFNTEDALPYQERFTQLYEEVMAQADFSLGKLNGRYFIEMKRALPDWVVLKGFFADDQLVGFSFAMDDGGHLEANFVGIDYSVNYEMGVYQRMLYEFVSTAIDRRSKTLRLGRTAELMKSGFGAEPVPMKLMVKHSNVLVNQFLPTVLENIQPAEFEIRQPFKQELIEAWTH
jgi:predicted N-acyltransferase